MQKRAVQFTKKPHLPLFSSETADKFAKDYAIKKSFRHALHLVTAHLHRQNEVAHALRTRDFWLASLSMHFPIHFGRRAHEYPVTLSALGAVQRRTHIGRNWVGEASEAACILQANIRLGSSTVDARCYSNSIYCFAVRRLTCLC